MPKDSEHYTFRHQFDGKPGIILRYLVLRSLAKEYKSLGIFQGCRIRRFCVADTQKYCHVNGQNANARINTHPAYTSLHRISSITQ